MRKTISIIALLSVLLCGCTIPKTNGALSAYAFDTAIYITLYDHCTDNVMQELSDMISFYNNLWNPEIEASDIYRINHAAGACTEVDAHTISILSDAVMFSKQYNGLIDPTIGALSYLWDFDHKSFVPDNKEIENAVHHVNYQLLQIDPINNTVTLPDPFAKIDIGYIAKGYIADKMVSCLKEYNVKSAIINLGGNVYCHGHKNNDLFKVGIKDPLGESESIKVVSVNDCSVVTSGLYERGFFDNNVWYHHILDVKTGYPVKNNLLSVTIIGESSYYCDMLSTLLFIEGVDEGLKTINEIEGYEAIFYTDQKEIIESYSY